MAAKLEIEMQKESVSVKFVGLELHINYKPVAKFNSYARRERDLLADGIEALTRGQAVISMTRIDEKLPPFDVRVLVCDRHLPHVWYEAILSDGRFMTTDACGDAVECFPTHWMMLPEIK